MKRTVLMEIETSGMFSIDRCRYPKHLDTGTETGACQSRQNLTAFAILAAAVWQRLNILYSRTSCEFHHGILRQHVADFEAESMCWRDMLNEAPLTVSVADTNIPKEKEPSTTSQISLHLERVDTAKKQRR